jgi:hypothetical protein
MQEMPTQSFECKNLRSALNQPIVVDKLLQMEVDKGYLIGSFAQPPFADFRISPVLGEYTQLDLMHSSNFCQCPIFIRNLSTILILLS